MAHAFIGFQKALSLTQKRIQPLGSLHLPVADSEGFAAAENLCAIVDSPSADASLKDGYAVHSRDVAPATQDSPVHLMLTGMVSAGQLNDLIVKPKSAVRVLTGAKIPQGADAVVAGEFAEEISSAVLIKAHAEPGRNILPRGADVSVGDILVPRGSCITPGRVGLLAAGGLDRIRVVRKPVIALLATGDEIRLPGDPLSEGELYASNVMTLNAWCRRFGISTTVTVVKDQKGALKKHLAESTQNHDAVITSGGAWTSDRDLLANVLSELGWEKIYHRVRLGPGKAVGFGILNGKPIFILPGGPPSNLMAFLLLALPALSALSGCPTEPLREMEAILSVTVSGQADWTQGIFGVFEQCPDGIRFNPKKDPSRLKGMGNAVGLLMIREGINRIEAGEKVMVRLLS